MRKMDSDKKAQERKRMRKQYGRQVTSGKLLRSSSRQNEGGRGTEICAKMGNLCVATPG